MSMCYITCMFFIVLYCVLLKKMGFQNLSKIWHHVSCREEYWFLVAKPWLTWITFNPSFKKKSFWNIWEFDTRRHKHPREMKYGNLLKDKILFFGQSTVFPVRNWECYAPLNPLKPRKDVLWKDHVVGLCCALATECLIKFKLFCAQDLY